MLPHGRLLYNQNGPVAFFLRGSGGCGSSCHDHKAGEGSCRHDVDREDGGDRRDHGDPCRSKGDVRDTPAPRGQGYLPSRFRPRGVVITVRLTGEVLDYLRKLPPQSRHAIRVAIKGLGKELGDIKPLTEELEGFHRLRVGSHRVLFEYEMVGGKKLSPAFSRGRNVGSTRSSRAA